MQRLRLVTFIIVLSVRLLMMLSNRMDVTSDLSIVQYLIMQMTGEMHSPLVIQIIVLQMTMMLEVTKLILAQKVQNPMAGRSVSMDMLLVISE